MVFHQTPHRDRDQFLMLGKHPVFRLFRMLYMDHCRQPLAGIQNIYSVFPELRHHAGHICGALHQII